MTTTRTTADNPFAAHSMAVLRDFAGGHYGLGPFTCGPSGIVWGTIEQAREELEVRREARRAARRARP